MKKVLALVLALGMTSVAFAENFNDEKENIPMGVELSDSKLIKKLAQEIAEILLKNEAATGEFEHEDDNGRGR